MTLRLNGSTSGYVEIDAPATAGSNTLVLPTGNGSNGQYLQTNGSGALSWATVAAPTVIKANGFTDSDGAYSSSTSATIAQFTGLNFTGFTGNLLQVFGRTTLTENTNTGNTFVLYAEIVAGANTLTIAGSRNGYAHGGPLADAGLDISTSGIVALPSTYATTNVTINLKAGIDTGGFWYGDQPTYTNYDNINGRNGGVQFYYMVFG